MLSKNNFQTLFGGFLLLTVAPFVAAQTISPPRPRPTAPVRVEPLDPLFTRQIPEPPAVSIEATREQRQGSYAKLLEAQRYLWTIQQTRSAPTAASAPARAARQALLRAVELNPRLAEGYLALAELNYLLRINFEESERLAEFAVRFAPDNLRSRALLGQIYTIRTGIGNRGNQLNSEYVAKAVAAWREVVRLDARNAEAYGFLSEFYERTGREAEALEALRGLINAAAPFDNSANFFAAVTGEQLAAEVAAAKLGAALARTGKTTEAVQLLTRAVADAPDNDSAVASLEETLANADPAIVAAVIEPLQTAAISAPGNRRLVELLADIQLRAGKPKEALQTLRTAIEKVGDASEGTGRLTATSYLTKFAVISKQTDDRAAALTIVGEARRRYADDLELLVLEAHLLAETNKVDEAAKLLRSKIVNTLDQTANSQTRGTNFYLQTALASLYADAKRGSDAIQAAQTAVGFAPSPELQRVAQLTLANAQNTAGDFRAAEVTLRAILKSDPNDTTALNNLGYYLVERNERLSEAVELINKAVERDPTNPSFLDSLGWAYFKLGRLPEAERYVSDAARRSPNSGTIQDHLGDVYQRQGKPDKAREAWRKALALTSEPLETQKIRGKLDAAGRTSK